jgi:MFS transporter, OFA family, oxalate/formate antiporter
MSSHDGVGRSGDSSPRPDLPAATAPSTISSQQLVQLIAGIVCMAMVANLQYGWTIFIAPLHAEHHWSNPEIQLAFTLFVLFETWLVPFEAYLADRLGPRPVVMFGALLVACSWIVYSKADTLFALYAGGIIGGIGTGFVYGTCVGNAVKWFSKRRGLAAGFTAAGFGAGAAITILPLTHSLAQHGYRATFFNFALIQGGVILVAALLLQKPTGRAAARTLNPRLLHTQRDSTPLQMLRSPVFYLMYVAFVCVAASGLMATAQLAPIANGFGIAKVPVNLFGIVIPALTFALSLNNLMNGLSRPLFGWVSDWFGREMTMFATFLAEGIGILCLARFGNNPVAFVLLAGLVFFAWGNIFSIFPALTSDHFGTRLASTNYGVLYTAKGTAALFVPIGSILAQRTGSWETTLIVAAIANVAAALIMLILPRVRRREMQQQQLALEQERAVEQGGTLAPAD